MADDFRSLRQYIQRIDAVLEAARVARGRPSLVLRGIDSLFLSRRSSYGHDVTEAEEAAMRAILDATKAKLVCDAEDFRDASLRAAAADIDAIRAVLCSTAAAAVVELGALARDLRAEAEGRAHA